MTTGWSRGEVNFSLGVITSIINRKGVMTLATSLEALRVLNAHLVTADPV